MTKLVIEIECDNAPFFDGRLKFSPEPELAYILTNFITKTLSDGMLRPGRDAILRDSNGNRVGTAHLTE